MNVAQIIAGISLIVGAFFVGLRLGQPPKEYNELLRLYRLALQSSCERAAEAIYANGQLAEAEQRIQSLEARLNSPRSLEEKILT